MRTTETPLPSISIVIPNLNGGKTLARCLDSLLDQAYPSLEIVVMDGGSSDNSVEILQHYAHRLTAWVSEPDQGQSDALSKGFARITGDITNWLCSDDVLTPGSLHWVGTYFNRHPDIDVVTSACEVIFVNDPARNYRNCARTGAETLMPAYNGVSQQSTFWRTRLHQRQPLLDLGYHYAMDQELWCWFTRAGARWGFETEVLSHFYLDGTNKTSTGGRKVAQELERIYQTYGPPERISLSTLYRKWRYPVECALGRDRGRFRRLVMAGWQLTWMALLMPFYGYRRVRYMSWPT